MQEITGFFQSLKPGDSVQETLDRAIIKKELEALREELKQLEKMKKERLAEIEKEEESREAAKQMIAKNAARASELVVRSEKMHLDFETLMQKRAELVSRVVSSKETLQRQLGAQAEVKKALAEEKESRAELNKHVAHLSAGIQSARENFFDTVRTSLSSFNIQKMTLRLQEIVNQQAERKSLIEKEKKLRAMKEAAAAQRDIMHQQYETVLNTVQEEQKRIHELTAVLEEKNAIFKENYIELEKVNNVTEQKEQRMKKGKGMLKIATERQIQRRQLEVERKQREEETQKARQRRATLRKEATPMEMDFEKIYMDEHYINICAADQTITPIQHSSFSVSQLLSNSKNSLLHTGIEDNGQEFMINHLTSIGNKKTELKLQQQQHYSSLLRPLYDDSSKATTSFQSFGARIQAASTPNPKHKDSFFDPNDLTLVAQPVTTSKAGRSKVSTRNLR